MASLRPQIGAFPVSTSNPADPFEGRRQTQLREPTMADRASLEMFGFILGGVTALVIAIAAFTVRSHVDTPIALELEQTAPVVPVALSPQR